MNATVNNILIEFILNEDGKDIKISLRSRNEPVSLNDIAVEAFGIFIGKINNTNIQILFNN